MDREVVLKLIDAVLLGDDQHALQYAKQLKKEHDDKYRNWTPKDWARSQGLD